MGSGWSNEDFTLIIVSAGASFSGVFIYSPAPGPGNLVKSITAQSGTDPYGNAYTAIDSTYGAGGQFINLAVSGGQASANFFTGTATEAQQARMTSAVSTPGTVSEQQEFVMFGPVNTISADQAVIQLLSAPHNQANAATGFLLYEDSSGGNHQLVAWGGLGVSRASIGGLNGGIPLTTMDSFSRTITAGVFTQLTGSTTIPANDPVLVGLQQTIYTIEATGFGAWPAPTQVLGFSGSFMGISLIALNVPGGTAGHGFNFKLQYKAVILTTGATGTCHIDGWVSIRDATTGASYFTGPIVDSVAETVDTTTAAPFFLQAGWAVGGAGASITCNSSIFTRIGV